LPEDEPSNDLVSKEFIVLSKTDSLDTGHAQNIYKEGTQWQKQTKVAAVRVVNKAAVRRAAKAAVSKVAAARAAAAKAVVAARVVAAATANHKRNYSNQR
jgi:hypothetical protein